MEVNVLNIKNMVCNRCIMVVGQILDSLGIKPVSIELGKAVVENPIKASEYDKIKSELEKFGFELITDKRSKVVEEIKVKIIQLIHDDRLSEINISDYLTRTFNKDYSAISKLFSQMNGISIERYYILQKIERVKELLVYDEMTISEIAYSLGYSSVAHLSSQFKNITGMTPRAFKQLKEPKLSSLDML